MTILVTGGAGFIGSNFILDWLAGVGTTVVNLDKLTYAGNLRNLESLADDPRHVFVRGDICDTEMVCKLLRTYRPRAIVHLAAESHVDRSIQGPAEFISTNVNGTFSMLEAARAYWSTLEQPEATKFRFLHVSTDEVYGSLGDSDPPFSETTPFAPNSPYSASKAASDHLVRAYFHTYGLPTLTTNCSNNYGRFQFPEKLIPLVIHNALTQKPLPIYGDGLNIRDWLHVSDHCSALRTVLQFGSAGETYNIGGRMELTNLEVVRAVCRIVDRLRPLPTGLHSELITFVADRVGHDRRYAMNIRKMQCTFGWQPRESFESGLEMTVRWYMENERWVNAVVSGEYKQWVEKNYRNVAIQ